MATNSVVLEPCSPKASLIRSTVWNDATSRGIRSTDCCRTTVSSCGNSNANTAAYPTHAPITSALCRTVKAAMAPRRWLYSLEAWPNVARSRTPILTVVGSSGSLSWLVNRLSELGHAVDVVTRQFTSPRRESRRLGPPRARRGGRREPFRGASRPCSRGVCRTAPTRSHVRRRRR